MIISKESVISNSLPSIFWRMYSVFTLPQKRKFIIVLLLLLTQGFFEIIGLALILPLLYVAQDPTRVFDNHYLKSVYDFFQFNSTESFTVFLALILIFAFVFKGLYSLFVIRYQTKTSFEFAQSYINDQIKIGLEMDYLKFKSRNSNVMVQDMISIPTEFATNIMQPFLMLLSELIVALFIAIVVGYYNFKVFVGLIVVLIPPIVLFYRITRKKIIQLGHERNSLRAESFKFAFGAIHGIENVKITHSEDFFRFQILKSFKWLFEKMARLVVLENVPIRMIEFSAISAVGLLVIYSVLFTSGSDTILPLLVVFATAAFRLLPSMNRIVSNSVRLRASYYVFDRFDEFSKHKKASSHYNVEHIPFENAIVFKDVSFNYPGSTNLILNKINLKISKGEFIGFIGKSGQGKSTILKVFLKLFEPTEGVVMCDLKEIDQSSNRSWQKKIGYVQQEVYLLDGTIAENIAFGEDIMDRNRVFQCLKAAALDSLVENMKEGLDTLVGEFGNTISGGQKQRISIARALYRQAEVLVLDEATSSLDSETEADIMKTLENLKEAGMTIIVVAHRLTSLYACDRILEIKNGMIVNEFNYTELLINSDLKS